MARLLPFLILLAVAVLVFAMRFGGAPRSDRVYRPRANPFGRSRPPTGDANWVAQESEIAGVRDAYSSESIDRDRVLFRCGGCQAWYHDSSVRALERENAGGCALCGSTDLREVRIA